MFENVRPVKIIQNGAKSFTVKLRNNQTGDPYDLSLATAITTCFFNQDGSELMLSLGSGITVLNAVLGQLTIALTAGQTNLLAPTVIQTLELSLTVTGVASPFKIQIPNAYLVAGTIC